MVRCDSWTQIHTLVLWRCVAVPGFFCGLSCVLSLVFFSYQVSVPVGVSYPFLKFLVVSLQCWGIGSRALCVLGEHYIQLSCRAVG